MRQKGITERIIERGRLFSEELGIRLRGGEGELFKWLLASVLYGKRISEQLATRTYRELEEAGVLSPQKVLEAGWDRLVELLDAGGYVRYDFSTATRLLALSKTLQEMGGVEAIHRRAENSRDLEGLLMELPGVGPTTANIFLRELRNVWRKADPEPSRLVTDAARNLGVDLRELNRKTPRFVHLECGLLRIGKDFCKRNKCRECAFGTHCRKRDKAPEAGTGT